jgi:hypothetical protein
MAKYAGSEWIEESFKVEMSPLGREISDLLGDVFAGIYHLNHTSLFKVDWANDTWIEFVLNKTIATFDNNELTRLVILCHDRLIRCSIEGAAPGYLRLVFHKRKSRTGHLYDRHPTIEQATEYTRRIFNGQTS